MSFILDSSMIFTTSPDPDYKIKGSRDPLGFQMVWSQVGKGLIKYLSTVSSNLRDFQTLLYFHYFNEKYENKKDNTLNFFFKFEQASAFARKIWMNDGSFNGANYVSDYQKNEPNTYIFSTKSEHTLLSNQKTYGIWGKYTRPFNDMALNIHDSYYTVMERAEQKTSDSNALNNLIKRLINEQEITVKKEDLKCLAELYERLSSEEESFFREFVLKTADGTHNQNEFYDLLMKQIIPRQITRFNTIDFTKPLLSLSDASDSFKHAVNEIHHSENVLFRLSSIFRYIQTRSVWKTDELKRDPFFLDFNEPVNYLFSEKNNDLNELNGFFSSDIIETIHNVIRRNKAICDRRSNVAWIQAEGDTIRVYHREGANENKSESYDNSYFILAYLNLFLQIEGGEQ